MSDVGTEASPPPSYHGDKTPDSDAGTEDELSSHLVQAPPDPDQLPNSTKSVVDEPPQSKFFVRSQHDASLLRRLTGRSLSNAPERMSKTPCNYWERYEVVFPPGYKDVKLRPSSWHMIPAPTPRYYVWHHSTSKRYQAEPITILRRWDVKPWSNGVEQQAVQIAMWYREEICKLVEAEVGRKARVVEKAHDTVDEEFGQWKIFGGRKRSRKVGAQITKAEGINGVGGAEHFVRRLRDYLTFIDVDEAALAARLEKIVALMRGRMTSMAHKQSTMLKPWG